MVVFVENLPMLFDAAGWFNVAFERRGKRWEDLGTERCSHYQGITPCYIPPHLYQPRDPVPLGDNRGSSAWSENSGTNRDHQNNKP